MPDEEATPPVHTVDGLRPPKGLKLSGADANWKKYKQLFEIYIEAAGLEKVRENRKIAIFLNAGGEEVVEVYNTLKEKDKGSLKALFSALDAYAEPLKSLVLKTYEFLNYRQQDGEAIDHFVTRLKNQGKKCELGEMEDRLVAIMLVIGIADSSLKERLLREESLDLDRAVTICRAAEAGRKQLQGIGGMAKENIDAFRKTTVRSQRREKKTGKSEGNKLCSKCGLHHEARKCPAFGRRCAVCSKYNHYAKQCRSNKKQEEKKLSERKKVHAVEEEDSTDSDNNVYLSSILTINSVKQQWLVKIKVCEKELEFKIDTGADCNTLSLKTYNKIKDNNCVLKRSKNVSLIVYIGEKINTVGQAELDCYYKNKSKVLTFNIIDLPVQPVIGLPDCIKLNLVKRVESLSQSNSTKESFVKQYKDVFKGLGEIGTYKIKVKVNAVPVIKPIRRVPHAIKDRLKETLDNYEKRGVIEKVEGPTEWCNNLVIVEKPDGSLRLCLDPKELNINILRENFLIPSPEEIYNNLQGKQVFSVLDMKDGFFQIKLVDEKNLCTFGTSFGRYKFNRMPFGISSAPEVMQKMNTKIFGDIEGTMIYFDDLIVAGKDEEEHDSILTKVMDRARKYNVKFNSAKLQYRQEHVKYVGLIINKEGISVNPDHIKAIVNLEEPKNVKQLQKFLGMCNYLSKFIPQYSKTTDPLRVLLRKDVEWNWGSAQAQAFSEIKNKLTCAPTLAMLSSKGNVVLQTDSSKNGMGACLMQEGRPISFYSRAYTECQTRWAPIEKELFAICVAVEKYHQFVYGRKILIETDHKPLVAIMSKDISKISARLQRMVLKLLKYNFEIKYIPGSQMYVADYLSRNFCNNKQEEPTLQEIVHTIDTEIVYGLEKELPISKEKLQILKNETLRDANLQSLLSWYSNGWPSNDRSFDNKELKVFYKLRNDIHVHNDIIHYKDRIVVPKHLRQEMIKCIHEGHAGVVKCKQRARRVLFWPGMSVDIENFVLGCKACEKFRPSNPKEPLMSHEVPDIPFHKVGVDICTFSGKDYLVLIDYYSKWIEVKYLKEKTACNVIKQFKIIMSVHGIPKICVSDNMPFSSFEFKKFAKKYDIELIHSSPRYPQSNGMSEKAVGIVKSLLKKCKEDGSDFAMGLLAYRTTPVAGLEYSPSELLMSRLLRTTLPCVFDKLKPKLPIDVKEKMKTIKEKYTQNYDRTAKTKKSFEKGENVVIQNLPNKTWLPGKVLEKVKLRSYKVINEEGNVVRRNEKHINPSKNELVIKKEVLDSDRPVIDNSQDDNNVGPNVQEQNVSTEVPISTKSGRVVRTPQHLKDYHVY